MDECVCVCGMGTKWFRGRPDVLGEEVFGRSDGARWWWDLVGKGPEDGTAEGRTVVAWMLYTCFENLEMVRV